MNKNAYYVRRHVEGLRGRVFAAAAACLLKRDLLAIEMEYRGDAGAPAGEALHAVGNPRRSSYTAKNFLLLKYAQGLSAPKFERDGIAASGLVQSLIEENESLRYWGMHPIWAILHAQVDRNDMRAAVAGLPESIATLMLADPGDQRADLQCRVMDEKTLSRLRRMDFDTALTAHVALVCTSALLGNIEARAAAFRSLRTLAGKAAAHPVWEGCIFDLMMYMDAQMVRRQALDARAGIKALNRGAG